MRVREILVNPDSPAVPRLEEEVDGLIYELHGLTVEEIGIVEGKSK